ncbi:MAG: hypothetical protein FWD96_00110 [Defluviitaleaceae bacterium]|nr:hypothetical protein [Defluviitaleaceae bacterium]
MTEMPTAGKIALRGLSNVSLAPVIRNTQVGYEVGEPFALPWVLYMSLNQEIARNTVWADDDVYVDMANYMGTHVTISLAELSLDLFAKLGMGTIDEDDGSVYWNPGITNKEFFMSFACLQANNEYRMHRMFVFTVDEIRQGVLSPIDSSGRISHYELVGKFIPRRLDGKAAQILDGENLAWLKYGTL